MNKNKNEMIYMSILFVIAIGLIISGYLIGKM